ncbi:MAG: hypothetical protein IJ600_09505 [Lachnospiraceae bacterium]|nr:hypothetical protein [Lachnospiraceae bacterium]
MKRGMLAACGLTLLLGVFLPVGTVRAADAVCLYTSENAAEKEEQTVSADTVQDSAQAQSADTVQEGAAVSVDTAVDSTQTSVTVPGGSTPSEIERMLEQVGGVAAEDGSWEIPGFGILTQQEINEIAGYTQGIADEYLTSGEDRPMEIIREPDMLMFYDAEASRYRYILPDGQWIECNIPQGAFTRGQVNFNTSNAISGLAHYRDGVSGVGRGPFLESGSYVVTFWDLNVGGDANKAYRLDFCFTIYSDIVMNLSHIEAPAGMETAEVQLDGRPLLLSDTDRRFLQCREDGEYQIAFEGGGARYEMRFVRDTTPPAVRFTPEYSYGKQYDRTVYFTPTDPQAQLEVLRNQTEVSFPKGEIIANGEYTLTVSDAVGNSREYRFSIRAPIPLPWKQYGIVFVIGVLALTGASVYWRRNMTVR